MISTFPLRVYPDGTPARKEEGLELESLTDKFKGKAGCCADRNACCNFLHVLRFVAVKAARVEVMDPCKINGRQNIG
jgi:hypothetical protein